jgi:hypothetical protein
MRIVRCNGQDVCQECARLGLRCHYEAAKSASRTGHQRGNDFTQRPVQPATPGQHRSGSQPPSASNAQTPKSRIATPPNLPTRFGAEFFRAIVSDYHSRIYQFYPIVSEVEVVSCVVYLETDRDGAAFLHALAAATITWSTGTAAMSPEQRRSVEELMQTSLELRIPRLDPSQPSIIAMMTPVFLHLALAGLQKYEGAWYYLREAIALAQLRASIENWFSSEEGSHVANPRGQRLYWMLFVHERFMSIRLGLPVVLRPLLHPPPADSELPEKLERGFQILVKMFRLLDDEFFSYWLREPSDLCNHAAAAINWVATAQANLEALRVFNEIAGLSDVQQADLSVTKLWIHVLLWKIALRAYPASSATEISLFLQFPTKFTRDLAWTMEAMSQSDIQPNRNSMVYKLFELTIAALDVARFIGPDRMYAPEAALSNVRRLVDLILHMDQVEDSQKILLHLKLDDVTQLL